MQSVDSFAGKTAVVTGAAGGLGKALAAAAARRGMNVVLADKDHDRLSEAATALEADGAGVLACPTDVTDPQALERLADAAIARFGPVHLLLNNAGIETVGFSWQIPASTWALAAHVNFLGMVNCANAFARRMIEAGEPARIANVASIAALGAMPVTAPYMATKHAVLSFSECLRLELEFLGHPIDVSVILPGPVATAIFRDAPGTDENPLIANHRRIMTAMLAEHGMSPDEAAETIFDQLAEGRFWIATHPEMTKQMAAARGAYLAELAPPELREDQRRLLAD